MTKDRKSLPLRKAVALKYQAGTDRAPSVAAKGAGKTADKIIEKAMQHGIAVEQDASLVEVLSRLELNQEIPPELYRVIAEILSFVYQSDRRAKEMQGRDADERE